MERKTYTIDLKTGLLHAMLIEGSAIDNHCHSKYSSQNVQTGASATIGVQESNTSIKKLYKMLKKREMDFFTVSDHNTIKGALELRNNRRKKGLDDSIINCEYDVSIDPCLEPGPNVQIIHVGCCGLDYADNATRPLSDNDVMILHNKLLDKTEEGYKSFINFCYEKGIGIVFNHPGWQGNTNVPLSGKQLEEICIDFSKVNGLLEINGDHQNENLLALELAQLLKMPICCGTDAHLPRRLGNQYTVAWNEEETESGIKRIPVKDAREYLTALKEGRVGIGSRFEIPEKFDKLGILDLEDQKKVVKYQFNGDWYQIMLDVWHGTGNYVNPFTYWNARKALFLGSLTALPFLIAPFSSYTAMGLFGLESLACSLLINGIPIVERLSVANDTRTLYKDWKKYHADLDTAESREQRDYMFEELKLKEEQIKNLELEVSQKRNEIEEKELEISEIYEQYEIASHLPKLNPKLRHWHWLSHKFVNALPWVQAGGPKTSSKLTIPKIKKKKK